MKRTIAAIAVAGGALAAPAVAPAHVSIAPAQAPAGAFTVIDVRVPNERDDASTVKVDVKLPAGFVSASYEAVPGWSVRLVKQKLSTPIQTDDGPIDEQVGRVVWTASSAKTGIAPGAFRDFPLSVQIPGKAGQTLTFKALQTYSNGEVVRWIGGPDADEPAPQLKLTAASAAPAVTTAQAQPASRPSASGDNGSKGLSIVALVVGALGLLTAAAALFAARRATSGPAG